MKRLAIFVLLAGLAWAAPDVRRPIFILNLLDGRTLTNVTLVSFAHSAVMAKWDGGRGTLPYEIFPADWQKALEVMRPAPASVTVRLPAPPPPPPAAAGAEPGKAGATEAAPEGTAPPPEAAPSKALEGLAAEIADLRARLEKIEKRLRMN